MKGGGIARCAVKSDPKLVRPIESPALPKTCTISLFSVDNDAQAGVYSMLALSIHFHESPHPATWAGGVRSCLNYEASYWSWCPWDSYPWEFSPHVTAMAIPFVSDKPAEKRLEAMLEAMRNLRPGAVGKEAPEAAVEVKSMPAWMPDVSMARLDAMDTHLERASPVNGCSRTNLVAARHRRVSTAHV